MGDNKKLIVSIICSLMLLISGTYAAMTFLTEKTDVTMVVDGDEISFNAGDSMTVEGIMPVYSMEEGVTKDIEIYKENGNYTAGIDLYLKLTSWDAAFASSSFRWALYKNNNYLSSGDFSGKKEGNEIKLTSYPQKINLINKKDTYKLYLWIDAYSESSIDMMKKSFTVNLYGKTSFYDGSEVVFEESTPNAPELADGMIPIRYNYIIDEWQKADSTNTNNNWYNYDSKMWANAVLVTSSSRERYMTATEGTTVDEKDILAYYVWIPRYKYLLFNVNSEKIAPREIQIVFEKTTDPISSGTNNGEYLSHPAFWWDNNSDNIRSADGSEELAGIWVGKFETGGEEELPLIKPNINAIINRDYTKNFFDINKIIDSVTYLTELGVEEADPHMIKNTQWGAVAYLSHSRYGINKNVASNNNTVFVTGRQGNYTYNDFLISDGKTIPSKHPGTGTLASTTGNVYGIYDMSGGTNEYMMAVLKSSSSSDTPFYSNSGFNASTMPDLKYYDLYEYGTNSNDLTRRILGDATGEINGWYQSTSRFVTSSGSTTWFSRGGWNGANMFYNLLSFNVVTGRSFVSTGSGSRSVIVIP